MERPDKLQTFIDMLMKEAMSYSFNNLCDSWGISEEESDQCIKYIEKTLGVKI